MSEDYNIKKGLNLLPCMGTLSEDDYKAIAEYAPPKLCKGFVISQDLRNLG